MASTIVVLSLSRVKVAVVEDNFFICTDMFSFIDCELNINGTYLN